MERGYVKLWRKIEDSAVFEDAHLWQLFSWIMVRASRRQRGLSAGIDVQPGAVVVSQRQLAERFKCNVSTISRRLQRIQALGAIEVSTQHRFTVITLCNWRVYQSSEDAACNTGATMVQQTCNDGATQTQQEQEREKERIREGEKDLPSEDCSEPPRTAITLPFEPVPLSDYVFPTKGKGAQTWTLRQDKLDEYREAYPDLDVDAELRRARQWCRDHPAKRKTAGGMLGFLTRWFNNTQNRPGGERDRKSTDRTGAGKVHPSAVANDF